MVLTSTSEVYGTAQFVPITESHPLRGQSPYAASKIGSDALGESYHRSFDLPVSILRPFNTFGPRQSARAIIPTIISQALSRPVVRLGSLDPRRDLTYVKDTARGFLAIAESPERFGRTVNIGRGDDLTIGELVRRSASGSASRSRSKSTPTGSAPPPARWVACWLELRSLKNCSIGNRSTAWMKLLTRRSPGYEITSTCSGSIPIRPESSRRPHLHRSPALRPSQH